MLPLTLVEHPTDQPPISHAASPLPFPWNEGRKHEKPFPASDLLTFLGEHPKQTKQGYIVCRCSRPAQLHEKITALPWFCL
ncbi:MAG: hypothetical protein ABSG59_09980 [Verrucomicrobiota bacterium]